MRIDSIACAELIEALLAVRDYAQITECIGIVTLRAELWSGKSI